jgi:metal-dependent amidase/aminoacylase/carboxypeptidase family protein
MTTRYAAVAALLLLLPTPSLSQNTPRLPERVAAHVKANEADLIAMRRDLHRHPELSGQETRTAGVVADHLRGLGLEVRTGIGGHGVVGLLRGGRPGRLVAYRADMDAVRSAAPDPVDFRSEVPGVRHICGHDLHVTIGLGLAAALASVREDLPGTVMFIFQPAEERATGARAMLEDGVFAARKPDAIFGLHSAPFEAGILSSKAGLMMHPNAVAPGVTNNAALTASAKADITRTLGERVYVELQEPPAGFSEDFGAFQAVVPGVFFFLGVGNEEKKFDAMPHSPGFVAEESAIAFGIAAMAAAVIGQLPAPAG